MPVDRERLLALVDEVTRFRVKDRDLERAHKKVAAALDGGKSPDDVTIAQYLSAVGRYFTSFEREARGHLRDVDRRLASVSQLQFNLTAERGVAARRIELTQGVLSAIAELRPR
jgi:hypothetical protein